MAWREVTGELGKQVIQFYDENTGEPMGYGSVAMNYHCLRDVDTRLQAIANKNQITNN